MGAPEDWRSPTVDGNRLRACITKRFQKGLFVRKETTVVIPDTAGKNESSEYPVDGVGICHDFTRFVGTIDAIVDVAVDSNVTLQKFTRTDVTRI